MLDDMGTAFISATEFNHLDKALIAVRTAKKSLRAQGFNNDYISDYFIQRSYLSKTTLRQLRNESIFTGEGAEIKEEVIKNNYNVPGNIIPNSNRVICQYQK